MKIVIDITDLKDIEDMLARAMLRAFRTLAREGALAPAPAAEAAAPVPPAPPAPPRPMNGTPAPPDLPAPPQAAPPADVERTPTGRARSRSVRDVVRCVADRPDGFYPRSDAAAWLAQRGMNNPEAALSKWILNGEIGAVIVTDSALPPTKGLPGRLMVKRADVKERDRLRLEQMPGRWRDHHGNAAK